MTSSGRSRARTSCWVIVEAPRSLTPEAFSATAEISAAGSMPALSQNERSSAVVVASRTRVGISAYGDDAPALVLEPPELHLVIAVVDDRRLREGQLAEIAGVRQVGRQHAQRRHRHDRRRVPPPRTRTTRPRRGPPQTRRARAGGGVRRRIPSARRIAMIRVVLVMRKRRACWDDDGGEHVAMLDARW